MKKDIILKSVFMVFFAALIFSSCNNDDTQSPLLFITPDSTTGEIDLIISLNDPYIEFGATSEDNKDGDISEKIEITHDIELTEEEGLYGKDTPIELDSGLTIQIGEYIVSYSVTDDAGNNTTLERKVTVRNNMYKFENEYGVTSTNLTNTEPDENFDSDVEMDEEINKRIWFSKFNGKGKVYADINMQTKVITLPKQTITYTNSNDVEEEWVFQQIVPIADGGNAGEINTSNYDITIRYTASKTNGAAEDFEDVYERK